MDFPQPLLPDRPLGMLIDNRYQIQKLLGRGGFGQTYLAYDTQCFNHPCVLKEFAPASRAEYAVQKARQLFEREARILYEIDHPQIPKFLAWFVDRERLFLVQEYIAGKTYAHLLRQRQQQGQTFSEAEVVQWILNLLPVLQYLHQRQIVHRDISPDNVMLPDGKTKPVLIDFGLVKQSLNQLYSQIQSQGSQASVESASFVGKFGYAPPEQIRMGQCFPSSDLYALGVTALVLLTGQEPRLLMDHESLEWRWQGDAHISSRLAQVLEHMVQEKPKARYQTVEEVLLALQPLAASLSLSSLPTTASLPQPKRFADSPTSTPSADLNPAFLQRCQQELTSWIGPIASFVFENTLAQHPYTTPVELIDALTLEIPDPVRANAFKARLLNLLRSSPELTISATPSRQTTSKPTPAQQTHSPHLNADFLKRCQQALTRCIGPVAGLILDDLLMQNPQMTPEEFIEAIVAEIPSHEQAQAFRRLMQ